MSVTVTQVPRSWVTAVRRAARGVFTRPTQPAAPSCTDVTPARLSLPAKALLVLDLADDLKVYEDRDFRSWAEPARGQRRHVTPYVDLLYGMNPPLIDRGKWTTVDVEDGADDFRLWESTTEGRRVLAEVWAEICGGVL